MQTCRIWWIFSRSMKQRRARFTRRCTGRNSYNNMALVYECLSHERNFEGTTMATKTSSKTASRKPAAPAAARKTTAAHKPAAAPKSKVPKKELKSEVTRGSAAATAASKSRVVTSQDLQPGPALP